MTIDGLAWAKQVYSFLSHRIRSLHLVSSAAQARLSSLARVDGLSRVAAMINDNRRTGLGKAGLFLPLPPHSLLTPRLLSCSGQTVVTRARGWIVTCRLHDQ